MQSSIGAVLNGFVLPDGAREDIIKSGAQMRNIDEGLGVMSGHDRGVAYRFFRHSQKNEAKSKAAKVLINDTEHMIEWNKGKRSKPTEKVRFLPPELLFVDEDGEVSGVMAESFRRYLAGISAPGLSLARWGALDDSQVAMLTSSGIFSVEQFAAQPRNKVQGKFPVEIVEKFEEAIQFVNGQAGRFETEALAKQNVELQAQIAKRDAEFEELKAKVALLSAGGVEPVAAKRGRKPKKVEGDSDE